MLFDLQHRSWRCQRTSTARIFEAVGRKQTTGELLTNDMDLIAGRDTNTSARSSLLQVAPLKRNEVCRQAVSYSSAQKNRPCAMLNF